MQQKYKDFLEEFKSGFTYFLLGLIIFVTGARHLWKTELERVEQLCHQDNNDTVSLEDEEKPMSAWYESVPMPPIVVGTSRTLPQGACGRQLQRYIEELRSGTLWATQMFDASVKYPHGVLDGYTRHLGSFDQCYRIRTQLRPKSYDEYLHFGAVEHVAGKYCLVDIKYEEKDVFTSLMRRKLSLDFDPNFSTWEAIREQGDFRRVKRYLLQIGLCVPARCSAEEIQEALSGPYDDFAEDHDLTIAIRVDSKNCQTRDEAPKLSRGGIVYCLILLLIVGLVLVGTYLDSSLNKNSESFSEEILLSFSAKQSLQTLSEVSYQHRGLDSIHMFRFMAMCLVIFGHRALQWYFNPIVNARSFEKTFDIPCFILMFNGPILVDGFFGIGGLLTSFTLLNHLESKKRVSFTNLVILRYLRLTPMYAFMIFFKAYLLPLLGSGPQWPGIVLTEAENCASTWWSSLLYINNYVAMDRICMFQSWYLAVDFQCYVVSIFLVYEFWKRPRVIGYCMLLLVTFVSTMIPFYLTLCRRVQPLLIPFPFLTRLEMDSYFTNYYVRTHFRITAYLVGVTSGTVLFDYQKASWRISKKYSKGLFILLVFVMCYGSQGLGYQHLDPNSKPPKLLTAAYASLHRGAYAFGICSIVLLITMCEGLDGHYKFMTKRWAQPLSRLTYSAFLSHGVIQAYQMATTRNPRTFSTINILWDILPDIAFSFFFAFLMVIFIECPFKKLEKILITRGLKIFDYGSKTKEEIFSLIME